MLLHKDFRTMDKHDYLRYKHLVDSSSAAGEAKEEHARNLSRLQPTSLNYVTVSGALSSTTM